MRPIGIMAIVSAAVVWLQSAAAQETPQADRTADSRRETVHGNASLLESHQPVPQVRDLGAMPQRSSGADNGWKWTFDGQRPTVEYRMSDDAALRLRGTGGGVGVYLNLRF